MPKLDQFTAGYIECALWISNDSNDAPLEDHYAPDDLHADALVRIIDDCTKFQRDNAELLKQFGFTPRDHGHDFWLTRNGHGSGFWDRYGVNDPEHADIGKKLTEASEQFGECNLYVGDDGKLYI